MGGDPQQQQQGDLLNLGQSAVPSQLSGDASGILGALPQQQQEKQMMNTTTTQEAVQPLPVNQEGGALGPLGPVPQQSQGMALFSPLNQFMLANSGQNLLLNNMPGRNMGMGMNLMPNRFGNL